MGDPIRPYRVLRDTHEDMPRETLPRETLELMDALIEVAAQICEHPPSRREARRFAEAIAAREGFDAARTAALGDAAERLAGRWTGRLTAAEAAMRFTIVEAAEHAQVTTGTIWRWIRTGRLRGRRTGRGGLRISRADLESLLRAGIRDPISKRPRPNG